MALGLGPVPCVAQGDHHLSVQHMGQLSVFFGLPPEESRATYQEWASALRRVLEAMEAGVRSVPTERLGDPTPNRGRDLPELIFNIHNAISEMRRSLDSNRFGWETKDDYNRSRHLRTTEDLGQFCADVRKSWYRRASLETDEEAERPVETFRGTITHRQLLESQAQHATQHLRQIYLFLDQIGAQPTHRLTPEEWWPIQLGELVY